MKFKGEDERKFWEACIVSLLGKDSIIGGTVDDLADKAVLARRERLG